MICHRRHAAGQEHTGAFAAALSLTKVLHRVSPVSGGFRTVYNAELTVRQGQDWMARRDLLMSYQAVGHWLKFNLQEQ